MSSTFGQRYGGQPQKEIYGNLQWLSTFFLKKKRDEYLTSRKYWVKTQRSSINYGRREKQFSWATKWSPSFLSELFAYKIIENQIEFSSSGERIWINFSICGIIPSVS